MDQYSEIQMKATVKIDVKAVEISDQASKDSKTVKEHKNFYSGWAISSLRPLYNLLFIVFSPDYND